MIAKTNHINIFLAIAMIIYFGGIVNSACGRDISGDVWGIWSPIDNPFRVIGDIRIPPDSSLQIMAGCQIIFQGYYGFVIDSNSSLIANGLVSDSILFSASDSLPGWGGIRFQNSNAACNITYSIIENGNVQGDSLDAKGGALFIHHTNLTIRHSKISNNKAKYGGGIYADSSIVIIDSSRISLNHSLVDGGGILLSACGKSSIIGNLIERNRADSSYGGAYFEGDSIVVSDNFVQFNVATNYGGGLGFFSNGIQFSDNIIKNNSASFGGGMALISDFHSQIGPNLITLNHATGSAIGSSYFYGRGFGGGIYCERADIDFLGTTITFNSAYYGGGIFRYYSSIIALGTAEQLCNIYSNFAGCGNDIFSTNSGSVIAGYIDTFTLSTVDAHTAYLPSQYNFHILHGYYDPIYQDIFVDPRGDNFNDGTTPATALKNIGVAMIRAASANDSVITINVMPGHYSPSLTEEVFPINVKSNIKLIGNYGDSCIIDGEYSAPLFVMNTDSCITIKNISFINGLGALAINTCGDILVENNIFENNRTDQPGSCINVWWGLLNINHNMFWRNSTLSWWSGGVISLTFGRCRVQNNTFFHNIAAASGGSLWFTNSVVYGVNNIMWADSANGQLNEIANDYGHNMYEFDYNDISGNFPGIGNINTSPRFVDPENGSFNLLPSSPCIDNGDPRSPLDPDSSRADIGAYYYDHRVGINDHENLLPLSISLEQNYPNPFNNHTIIRYSIDKKQSVALEIFDITGRLVSTMQENEVEPGFHELCWDGKNSNGNPMTSGIYFYKLNVGNYNIVKKMIYLK